MVSFPFGHLSGKSFVICIQSSIWSVGAISPVRGKTISNLRLGSGGSNVDRRTCQENGKFTRPGLRGFSQESISRVIRPIVGWSSRPLAASSGRPMLSRTSVSDPIDLQERSQYFGRKHAVSVIIRNASVSLRLRARPAAKKKQALKRRDTKTPPEIYF